MPPTEKLFGCAWVTCWFIAIWIYHIQFFLTGLFCLFLALVVFAKADVKEKARLPVTFTMDKNARTLTVQKIYENNLNWGDSEVCSGNAILPSGAIKEGDVITKCSGNTAFRHIPTNTLFGAYDFE